jgi:hypothetical protein
VSARSAGGAGSGQNNEAIQTTAQRARATFAKGNRRMAVGRGERESDETATREFLGFSRK